MIVDLPVVFLEVTTLYILKLYSWFIKGFWMLEHLGEFYILSLQNICVV